MSILYRAYGSTADCRGAGLSATYSTARASTAATTDAALGSLSVGQQFNSPNYNIHQGFFQFDTSTFPAGSTGLLSLNAAVASVVPGDIIEISQVSAITNKIAGSALTSLTQLGSFATIGTTGRIDTTLSGTVPVSATLRYVCYAQNERLNVAPTAFQHQNYSSADASGTASDPYVQVLTGTSWVYVGRGTSVEATATSHVLTEPAGAASGDLLVACIASRIASTTQITLPSGWTRVAQQLNNNTATNTSATPSGMMAYIIRGGSAPSYTFTHPVAPSVALGRVVAYRNVNTSSPLDVATSSTTATAQTSIAGITGLVTTQDDDLVVALWAGGQEATWSAFAAESLLSSSSTTADSALDPIFGQFLERSDIATTTNADTSLAIFDGIKISAGDMGTMSAVASISAAHVMVMGAFKLAPPAPTGTTYNEAVAEAATAAEEVAVSQFVRSGPIAETAASADTVAGLLDATRAVAETAAAAETQAGTLVTATAIAETAALVETIDASVIPAGGIYNKDQVETASAVETVAGHITVAGAIAETAAAADTVAGQITFTRAIAESASAAETVGGLFNTTKAVAETAAAVDTSAGLLTVTGAVAETAAAAETLTGGLAVNITVAESASAADTITKALSFAGAVAETRSAADTTGGLLVRIGAVVETASAAETVAGLLTSTAAIVETASAAETITYSVTGAAGTIYNEAQAETVSAADAVSSLAVRVGAITESASAVETITRAVSYTGVVVEAASAADTVGGLAVRVGAVAETAAAVDTITETFTFTGAIVEAASAAETIKAGGTKPDTIDLIGTLHPTIPLTGRLLTPVTGLVGQQLLTANAGGRLSSATTMIGRHLPKRSLTGTTNG